VSAGEDNAGQIIMALMSFRKLKEDYPDYKGGLLLIDEADAGLFPKAQENLLKILSRECKELSLQIVVTSHSPILIEYAFEQERKSKSKYPKQEDSTRKFKTVYLSNTYGDLEVKQDWSWVKIYADISTKTINVTSNVSLPIVNVYFEDREAADFFAALIKGQTINKFTKQLSGVTLGCDSYIELLKHHVPEFCVRSIICLDPDAASKVHGNHFNTVVLLPGGLPPDQLIFKYLFDFPARHDFWNNDLYFSRDCFRDISSDLRRELAIPDGTVDVRERIAAYSGNKKPRELFKQFYKNVKFQDLIKSGSKPYNPWKHWVKNNPAATNEFIKQFVETMRFVMRKGFGVDESKLAALTVRLKKI